MIAAAWLAELSLIIYRDYRSGGRLPFPSEFLATFAIFGLLDMLPESGANLAAALGWGIVAATALHVFDPSKLGQGGKGQVGPAIGPSPGIGSFGPGRTPDLGSIRNTGPIGSGPGG